MEFCGLDSLGSIPKKININGFDFFVKIFQFKISLISCTVHTSSFFKFQENEILYVTVHYCTLRYRAIYVANRLVHDRIGLKHARPVLSLSSVSL